MRKLSVTDYLIQNNRAQAGGVTLYSNIGDAINAVTHNAQVTPEGQEAVCIRAVDGDMSADDATPLGAEDGAGVYEITCYAYIGYVMAWRMSDKRIMYTAMDDCSHPL